MTKYTKHGSMFLVTNDMNHNVPVDKLPAGTYTIKSTMEIPFFLEKIEDYELPSKLYGDTTKHAERILTTFLDRSSGTGVLLSGEQGSGKTMLAKKLAMDAQRDHGIPTIVINNPYCGESFNQFIQLIEQPTVIIFDEFEKVYDAEDQAKMLTLLDGVYPSQKLFILTSNDTSRINKHMLNRPGRIFYNIEYGGLEIEFISEYARDVLKPELHEHIDNLSRMGMVLGKINFDMLKAIVQEMNRFNESPQDAIKILNTKPDSRAGSKYYSYTLTFADGTTLEGDERVAPFSEKVAVEYSRDENGTPWRWGAPGNPFKDYDTWEDSSVYVIFEPSDIKSFSATTRTVLLENKEGEKLKLTEKPAVTSNWAAY